MMARGRTDDGGNDTKSPKINIFGFSQENSILFDSEFGKRKELIRLRFRWEFLHTYFPFCVFAFGFRRRRRIEKSIQMKHAKSLD